MLDLAAPRQNFEARLDEYSYPQQVMARIDSNIDNITVELPSPIPENGTPLKYE